MKIERRQLRVLAIVILTLGVIAGTYHRAEAAPKVSTWPSQDIMLIVPRTPGGGFDLSCRITAPFIQKHLPKHANVVVKNVPGAGGKVGLREVAKAKPDGHTIGVFDPEDLTIMKLGGLLEDLDIGKLTWLAQVNALPDLMVVGVHTGIKKPSDMKGKTIRMAVSGPGEMLRAHKLAKWIGAKLQYVYVVGTPEAFTAIMRGDIDAISFNWASSMQFVQTGGGKLIPIFVNSTEHVPGLDVPTSLELGVKVEGFITCSYKTLAGPPGFSPEIRQAWTDTLSKTFSDAEWIAQMNKATFFPSPLLGDKLDAQINAIMGEVEKYKDIVPTLLGGGK